ncbi:Ribosomal RNA small subunit methyltransferase C [Roseivivax sp. THAF40]|uniref:class I SAM-dependent methyltransferase n=1 Tax=unclassified Roseivivax TaxID=2639302 RepID=UPI0012697330|nr:MULTISPECIES: class I SAM-dependent methyltransferase [unclassified Roseivivax]QFS81567.1 Ribosomal RNA small subunit methyltransferase C [Roseivivax sp. THAF197b]QFT45296.1 Ribosomal RNA small subunit methyltransferase C [Roseivivax sp. THAF40]
MTRSRLTHALETGAIALPETGRIALFNPRAESDLSELPKDRCHVIQRHYPDHAALQMQGFDCAVTPEGDYSAAIVTLPRARAEAEALIGDAEAAVGTGPIIVDGAKTDGVEPLLKAVRARTPLTANISKAHGKCFAFKAGGHFGDWRASAPEPNRDGFLTLPGVFSADGIDPASALLVESLPDDISGRVADLGAGWGYLSRKLLERDAITSLDLVEADHAALECARANLDDPRARFHWADARDWTPEARLDVVVTNPPFHVGRAADPALGRAFLAAAARGLAPTGRLFVVANRQLPYEDTLATLFAKVDEIAANTRFKVLLAQRPARKPR